MRFTFLSITVLLLISCQKDKNTAAPQTPAKADCEEYTITFSGSKVKKISNNYFSKEYFYLNDSVLMIEKFRSANLEHREYYYSFEDGVYLMIDSVFKNYNSGSADTLLRHTLYSLENSKPLKASVYVPKDPDSTYFDYNDPFEITEYEYYEDGNLKSSYWYLQGSNHHRYTTVYTYGSLHNNGAWHVDFYQPEIGVVSTNLPTSSSRNGDPVYGVEELNLEFQYELDSLERITLLRGVALPSGADCVKYVYENASF